MGDHLLPSADNNGSTYPRYFDVWKRHGGVSERDVQVLTHEAQAAIGSSGGKYQWQTCVNKHKEKLAIQKLRKRFPHGLPAYVFTPPPTPPTQHQSIVQIGTGVNNVNVQVGNSENTLTANSNVTTSAARPVVENENGFPSAAPATTTTTMTTTPNDSTVQTAAVPVPLPAQPAAATTLATSTSLTRDATIPNNQHSSRQPAQDAEDANANATNRKKDIDVDSATKNDSETNHHDKNDESTGKTKTDSTSKASVETQGDETAGDTDHSASKCTRTVATDTMDLDCDLLITKEVTINPSGGGGRPIRMLFGLPPSGVEVLEQARGLRGLLCYLPLELPLDLHDDTIATRFSTMLEQVFRNDPFGFVDDNGDVWPMLRCVNLIREGLPINLRNIIPTLQTMYNCRCDFTHAKETKPTLQITRGRPATREEYWNQMREIMQGLERLVWPPYPGYSPPHYFDAITSLAGSFLSLSLSFP